MSKQIIEAHPSLVIAHNPSQNKLLLSVYDSGYRKGIGPYPTKPNCIGGNPDISYIEKNPLEVLTREVGEEFDPEYQIHSPDTNIFDQRVNWALQRDIALIRDSLIYELKSLKPHQDFYVNAESWRNGTATYQAIYSYFISELPDEVFETVESNLRRQKALVTEGLCGVYTLDELLNDPRGELSTAHITAQALNYTFGTIIPYPPHIKATPIGPPRQFFKDYLTEFEYLKDKKPNHNDPSKFDPSFHDVIFGKT